MSPVTLLCIVGLAMTGLATEAVAMIPNVPCGPYNMTRVIGDPHLIVYGAGPVDCAADGWRTYLLNPFFDLVAYASSFWVTKVELTFLSNDNRVRYITGTGPTSPSLSVFDSPAPPTSSFSYGGIIVFPGFYPIVPIWDWNSWTLFVIAKGWFNNYHIIVYSGECVYNASCGLLVDGCPGDYMQLPSQEKRSVDSQDGGNRIFRKCHKYCSRVPEYYEQCMFDCMQLRGSGKARLLIKDYNLVAQMEVIGDRILTNYTRVAAETDEAQYLNPEMFKAPAHAIEDEASDIEALTSLMPAGMFKAPAHAIEDEASDIEALTSLMPAEMFKAPAHAIEDEDIQM